MKSGIIIILGIYVAWCVLLFVFQRKMMFPRYLIDVPDAIARIPGMQRHWLPMEGGNVEMWYIPPDLPSNANPNPVVIFAHGNAELIDDWPQALAPFLEMGIGICLVEYPGYGRSQGSPSQKHITDAFVAAYDTLVSRADVDRDRILFMGRSIGGGAVCGLARHRASRGLILMSSFTSAKAFAPRYLAPGFLILDPFDNLSVLKTYREPVLVIHGTHDEIIPFAHGKKLANTASNARLIAYPCGHNDCPPDWRQFWKDIREFLSNSDIL